MLRIEKPSKTIAEAINALHWFPKAVSESDIRLDDKLAGKVSKDGVIVDYYIIDDRITLANAALCSVRTCYLDSNGLVWENPEAPTDAKRDSKASCIRSLKLMDFASLGVEEYTIEGYIPLGPKVCLLVGDSNAGKTFTALDMALSLCTGQTDWHGQTIHSKGTVAYLTKEGESGISKRITAWCQVHGVKTMLLENRFFIFDTDSTISSSLTLAHNESYAAFRKDLRENVKDCVLIVIDTLSEFKTGKENDEADMSVFIDCARQIAKEMNCPILVNHHTPKYASDVYRGSGAIRGNSDMLLILEENKDEDLICLWIDKNRDGIKGKKETSIFFRKKQVELEDVFTPSGSPITTLVLERTGDIPKPRFSVQQDRDFQILDDGLFIGITTIDKLGESNDLGFTREALRKYLQDTFGWDGDKTSRETNPNDDNRLVGRWIREKLITWNPSGAIFYVNKKPDGRCWKFMKQEVSDKATEEDLLA